MGKKLAKPSRVSQASDAEKSNTNLSDINLKEYFDLINTRAERYNYENSTNKFNVSLSLDKKDFNAPYAVKKYSTLEEKSYVHWKEFIVTFLKKQSRKGFDWAVDVLEFIKDEPFLSEHKWLSTFFWQEYEIRTKPECLKTPNDENGTERDKDKENNANDDQPHPIRDRLSGSFYSVNTSSLSKNDPTHEYKEFRHMVKAYISIFKEHIFHPDHPINKIAKVFITTFSNYISDELKDLHVMRQTISESYKNIIEHRVNSIIKQLQTFILKLQACLRLMYSKTISYSCFVEEKDEFINLITNLIFRDERLHNKIEEVYRVLLFDKINQFQINISNLKDINPEDLSLNEKYCLNEVTRRYQKKLLEEHYKKEPSPKTLPLEGGNTSKIDNMMKRNEDADRSVSLNSKNFLDANKIINLNESPLKRTLNSDLQVYSSSNTLNESMKKQLKGGNRLTQTNETMEELVTNTPFSKAINLLRTLYKYRVPFEKMMLISTISLEITECVNDFWKDFENIIEPNNLNIDADELMSIFIFILIKSELYDLMIQTRIIKDFTTSSSKSTMVGYYFVTLEASLMYIFEIKSIDDLRKKDKTKENEISIKTYNNSNQNHHEQIAIAKGDEYDDIIPINNLKSG